MSKSSQVQSAGGHVGSDSSELVRVRQDQRYTFLATSVQRLLHLSLLDYPAVSRSPQCQNFSSLVSLSCNSEELRVFGFF